MKKKLISNIPFMFLVILGFICFPHSVHAYTIETLDRSSDYEEIKEMHEEIIASMEGFFTDPNVSYTVDYSRAVKIYIDTNIFAESSLSPEKVQGIVDNAVYIWEVPVKVFENQYVICTIGRKPPISEEVQKELLDNQIYTVEELEARKTLVGQWIISKGSYDPEKPDYIGKIDSILGEAFNPGDENQLYLLGGTPKMRLPFGLFRENNQFKIMTLDVTTPADDTTAPYSLDANLYENNIYAFSDVNEWIANEPPEGDGDTGYGMPLKDLKAKNNPPSFNMIIIYGGIAAIGAFALLQYFRIKKNKTKKLHDDTN